MKKTKMKKALLSTAGAALLVGTSVFGTMAYLTSTQSVTNTFTVGKVAITLDEADVDLMGRVPDGQVLADLSRVQTNAYKLIPGSTYIKDPTIHVDADSEDCYLFVKVSNGISDIEASDTLEDTIATQMDKIGWDPVAGYAGVYYYADSTGTAIVDNAGDNVKVFEHFTITPDNIENSPANPSDRVPGKFYIEDYITETDASGNPVNDATIIEVTAYGVQKEGFDSPLEAWVATFGA